jgi:hypothetical protein
METKAALFPGQKALHALKVLNIFNKILEQALRLRIFVIGKQGRGKITGNCHFVTNAAHATKKMS